MALTFQIDFRSGVPIYTQIVEQVQSRLLSGALEPGDQLPTVRQLASELRVNFNTIARAYRLLDEAGLISTQQGRGTYILERPTAETQHQLRQQALAALTRRYLQEAHRLGASPEEMAALVQEQLAEWQRNGGVDPE